MFKDLHFKISLLILIVLGGFSFAYTQNLVPPETISWLKITRNSLKTYFKTNEINSLEIIPDSKLAVKSRQISCFFPSDLSQFVASYEELETGQIITTFTNSSGQDLCLKITYNNNVIFAILPGNKSGSVGYKPSDLKIIKIIGR